MGPMANFWSDERFENPSFVILVRKDMHIKDRVDEAMPSLKTMDHLRAKNHLLFQHLVGLKMI